MGLTAGQSISFTSGGLALEGLLHLADATPGPGIVVCHPHPQYGGDMRNNVVGALCKAALDSGIAALRFNFRGVGESEGAYDNGTGEQQDVAAALDHLRTLPDIDASRIGLAGYSFGAAMALRAATADLRALVAVSTPTAGGWLGELALPCPTLFISGDRDEYSDPEALQEIVAKAGGRAELAVMPGVDHFWWGSDDRLIAKVGEFLRTHV